MRQHVMCVTSCSTPRVSRRCATNPQRTPSPSRARSYKSFATPVGSDPDHATITTRRKRPMKTTRTISTPLALGDILADITHALPDESQRFSPPPPTVVPTPAPTRRAATPPSPARPLDVPNDALFIGINWANDHHDLCLFDPATQQRTSQTIAHDPAVLHAWLASLHRRSPRRQLAVALEQNTGSLLNLLVEDAARICLPQWRARCCRPIRRLTP